MSKMYDESQIQVLEGLEPVRKRPGMYIGSTDSRGLHHLVYEVVDNSIDEAMAGECDRIEITLMPDNGVMVVDNGRGIPTGLHPTAGISTLEVVHTKLHAGGKFGGDGYKVSGGLHGVGVSVVNALSKKLIVSVRRGGKIYRQTYEKGIPVTDITEAGIADQTGTETVFYPDETIFDEVKFSFDTLKSRLRELAFLNKGVCIVLSDARTENSKSLEFQYEGGIVSFVEYLNKNRSALFEPIVYFEAEKGTSSVEVAMQYNEGYNETLFSFANNISTHEGGSHLIGFKSGLTRVINDYARRFNFIKDKADNLSGDDIREGLTAVISVKLVDPQFEGQTKTKLGNANMRPLVDSAVSEKFTAYLEENPSAARIIINKCFNGKTRPRGS